MKKSLAVGRIHVAIIFIMAAVIIEVPRSARGQLFTEVDPGLPAYSRPCVAWGDYDRDGDLDVLVAGPGKKDESFTTIYNNTGGTFSDSGVFVLGLQFAAAAWGDYDGDGYLDLAMIGLTTTQIPTTRIFHNNGGTNFTTVAGTFTGVYAGTVNWGDYDGDGDLDLLVTGVTTTGPVGIAATRLYRNDNGAFISASHPFPAVYLGAVAFGDYDKDGDLDVIVAGTSGSGGLSAGLWKNDGSGGFADSGASLPAMDIGFAAWGDYDGDGDLDLLFGGDSYDGWISRIYRNDSGVLTNANAGLLPLIWSSAAWGDYDNDGDLDALLMGYDPAEAVRVSRLYRNDAGAFVNSGQTFHDLFLGAAGWVNYDNDGDLDLFISGNTGTVGTDFLGFYQNNSTVSNTPPTAPTNLTVNVIGTSVNFSWSAATDAQTPSASLTYNLRVGTTPDGSQIVAAQSLSNGVRLLATFGNEGHNLAAKLAHLKPGTNYYWSVQAVDSAFVGSAFAAEGNFIALADPPVLVSASFGGAENIQASWRGTPGCIYQIFTSTNLLTWNLFATPTAQTNGMFQVTDSTSSAARFYKAIRP